ncbi:Sau3AI family type II restriction endonuclease [Peribacillus sp. NPDC097675]|uniref:Sau3AI family type II restriction endonuclease n=1 Tax=Peribacillus sp. NPDC097675 TaxID=3390618 RepID=UPI003D0897D2
MERIKNYDETNPLSIEKYGQQLIGKTFLDVIKEADLNDEVKISVIDKYGNARRKGGLGNLLEEIYFGYKANSDQHADFYEAGVELKASPYEKLRKGRLRAGERLVITMIGYDKPIDLDFNSSHVYEKIRIILLVYYLRNKELGNNLLYPIEFVKLFSPPEEDLKIIEDDYKKIVSKIQQGKAHELSEGDTMYLGACTKGSTALKSTVPQYYAPEIPARRRAFCLKNSYMTYILNNYIVHNIDTYESIVHDAIELENTTFEQLIFSKINSYIGYTDRELCNILGREYNNNKAQWIDMAYRMLGIKSNKAEEFVKANIVVKAIRLEEDGSMSENSSLPQIKLMDFVNEEWEDSTLYSYFEETRFLFVVFQKDGGGYKLKGCQLWNMPRTDLDVIVKAGWENIRAVVASGIKLTKKETAAGVIIKNNLPKKGDNPIIHIKPHSGKRFYILESGEVIGDGSFSDAEELPDGVWMQKQSFWISNRYILSQLNKNL